ncbi:acyltransferase family protein [Microlunatus soli]|uniref:Peptidoglycan/LPS O-acetylase OafA/YrhL, contains acyltransferase and SGNH-hydrolase domains n=1 Tax=Microlunatus soli TaxID=630515 RepID=A0A1H1ZM66_9ACTN|nr:acyltransferase [Microlunatus soli]SDT34808.1 Peptidoglycan/LPS O-acetylase OafA/YrhL, contains acyltransferase and SGNH-hydrolase domains [Microlunatus soli]
MSSTETATDPNQPVASRSTSTTATATATAAVPARATRLRGLDGLRFVAAFAVLGYHFTGIGLDTWGVIPAVKFPTLQHLTRYGFIGVELFFMISGFVILMTAYGRKLEDFVASRASRLFPAYWAAVIITVILQQFWHGGRGTGLMDGLVNLTMMQGAFDVSPVQGAFWTLWVELKFYLLMGVFVLVGITRRRVLAFALIWPVMGQLADATDTNLLNSLLFPTYAPFFAVGMLLFLIYRDRGDIVAWLGVGLNLIWCLQYVTDYAERASELVKRPVSPTVLAVIVLLMVVAIWAVSSGPLAALDWRWLTVVGGLTYPLYLIHVQFGFFIIDLTHEHLPAYLVLAMAIAVVLVLAVLLHYGVEERLHRPMRKAVRNALNKTSQAATGGRNG